MATLASNDDNDPRLDGEYGSTTSSSISTLTTTTMYNYLNTTLPAVWTLPTSTKSFTLSYHNLQVTVQTSGNNHKIQLGSSTYTNTWFTSVSYAGVTSNSTNFVTNYLHSDITGISIFGATSGTSIYSTYKANGNIVFTYMGLDSSNRDQWSYVGKNAHIEPGSAELLSLISGSFVCDAGYTLDRIRWVNDAMGTAKLTGNIALTTVS